MKLNIAQRVLAGYGVALLCMAAIGVAAYLSTAHLIESMTWVTHTHNVLGEAESILARLADAESAGAGYVLTGDDGYLQRFESAARLVAGSRKALRDLTVDNPAQQRRLDALEPVIEHKIAFSRETIDTRAKQGFPAALRAVETGKGQEIMAEVRNGIAVIEGEEQNLLRQRDQEARARAGNMTRVIQYVSLFGFVSLAWMGFAIQRSITRPLAGFERLATAVGQGDLTQRSVVEGGDELGRLAQGLNQMVTGLREVAEQTRAATENLNTATAEILAAAMQQAAGTGEQAAACQETNVTMQQVSKSCSQITEKAKQIASTAEATAAASNSGVEAVQNMSASMESIREQDEAVAENVVALSVKTQLVGEIIATVNDIAEQSHLLALNAAIEAAAAGEHGRSFSVVAGEIKSLADQSKEATVQVKSILGDIQKGINSSVMLSEEAVKRVDLGKRNADLTATTIREMSASIQHSLQAFQQIVAGTNQQQIGFEHVFQAVKDIGQASDQSASSTRKMENAAANLATLGEQLRKATDRYRL